MATKTKPNKQFIAINNGSSEVITMGSFEHIQATIQDYCEDWTEEEITNYVDIYELGNKKEIYVVATKFVINF